jgi:lysophospholipase L1-like esterase
MTKAKLRHGLKAFVTLNNVALAALLVPVLFWIAPSSALAQAPAFSFGGRSYITPFPQTDQYQVHVIGDGLADGLSNGLQAAFEKDGTVKIINSAKWSAGLTRSDPDLLTLAADLAKQQNMHVAVIMLGLNDVRNFRAADGTQQRYGTEGWRAAYAKEIDKLLKILKDNNVGVYWVGLPVMSNPKTSEAMGQLNDIFRERTYIAAVRYVDTWNGFTDQLGAFTSYGPDLSGQTKRLREADGTFFTAQGNRKLANYVEVLLRRDLGAAKAERNIPLAGDDDEQDRLIPKPQQAPKATAENPAPPAAAEGAAAPPAPAGQSPGQQQVATGTPPGQQPPVQQTRPAAPAPLQVPRQLSFRPGDAPSGETIVGDITSGVTALATVSPLNDFSANPEGRRLPLQERPYYKALIKGQPVKPKPGRADDFKWPKS